VLPDSFHVNSCSTVIEIAPTVTTIGVDLCIKFLYFSEWLRVTKLTKQTFEKVVRAPIPLFCKTTSILSVGSDVV